MSQDYLETMFREMVPNCSEFEREKFLAWLRENMVMKEEGSI